MINPLAIFGNHDEKTIQQMWRCLGVGNAVRGVLCADGHFGYAQPVGGVIAYRDMISVSGVGFDIGCGNMAVRTDMGINDIGLRIPQIARDINRKISFGVGRCNNERVDHPLFESDLWKQADIEQLKPMAREQLGTVGSGNHYVDLFRDEEDFIWIGVHFGSRGLGHKTATKYLALAGGVDGMDVAPAVLDAHSELGQAYIAGMTLAGEYAYAGREWVVNQVVRILAAKVTHSVHNHHNYAWQETHDGENLWVVRKGATPAFPGQQGFVGGSMGDNAVIIEGVESPMSFLALYSTVHGAGRVMGRMEAKGKKDKNTGEWKREPRIKREDMDAWVKAKGVYIIGGDVDEAPQAYRRLDEVLKFHEGTIKINHVLRPIVAIMAGKEVRDPYKD